MEIDEKRTINADGSDGEGSAGGGSGGTIIISIPDFGVTGNGTISAV